MAQFVKGTLELFFLFHFCAQLPINCRDQTLTWRKRRGWRHKQTSAGAPPAPQRRSSLAPPDRLLCSWSRVTLLSCSDSGVGGWLGVLMSGGWEAVGVGGRWGGGGGRPTPQHHSLSSFIPLWMCFLCRCVAYINKVSLAACLLFLPHSHPPAFRCPLSFVPGPPPSVTAGVFLCVSLSLMAPVWIFAPFSVLCFCCCVSQMLDDKRETRPPAALSNKSPIFDNHAKHHTAY